MPGGKRQGRQKPKQRPRRKWYQKLHASIDRARAREDKDRSGPDLPDPVPPRT